MRSQEAEKQSRSIVKRVATQMSMSHTNIFSFSWMMTRYVPHNLLIPFTLIDNIQALAKLRDDYKSGVLLTGEVCKEMSILFSRNILTPG